MGAPKRPRLTRRKALLGGVLAAVGAGAYAESLSFDGRWDHRRFPGAMGAARFAASRAALGGPAMIHVGHSTHLLHVGGVTLLTDPWFFDPAFGALSHVTGPAVEPQDVGALDVLLITHDHADHADLRAIDRLDKRAHAIVATEGLAAQLRARGFVADVLRPWEDFTMGGATVSAVPAVHDVYEVGFVVRGLDHCVYFAGDTKLHPDLPAIRERYAPVAAILPVDGTRFTGGNPQVMTPEDAVEAARILGATVTIPTHGEASFSDPVAEALFASTIAEAPRKFAAAMAKALPGVRCVVPAAGELVPLGPSVPA